VSSHHLVTNPLHAAGIQPLLLAGSLVVKAALERVPPPPAPQDGVKDGYQGLEFHFLPFFMVLKDKLDQASLRMGADTALGSGGAQQILHHWQDPSGQTQPHKTSISFQRHEDTPYPRCESSLVFGMPKAAASTPESFDFKPKAEAYGWVEARDRVGSLHYLCRSPLELHQHNPPQTAITSNLMFTSPPPADRVDQVNLGPSHSFAASSFRSFK